jgi:hypothetical protein
MKTMRPNDFGKKFLTEQCQKIEITDFIRKANLKLKGIILKSEIEAEGHNILLSRTKTGYGGTRYWFSCPICGKSVGIIYKHPESKLLGCRRCLGLDYRKHRYSKMIENDV